jgi:hypothetical protein
MEAVAELGNTAATGCSQSAKNPLIRAAIEAAGGNLFVLGKEMLGTIDDWAPEPGSVVCWHPSPASQAIARQAPISAVPPSHQQARHLRNFRDHATRGLDMSRLLIASWDIPGQCDIETLTYVLNAHLRRHNTYHSWFEFTAADDIVRHTFRDPADIHYVPVEHGEMTPAAWREHLLATPSPLEWDCARFAIIQRSDHFTFCGCMDHIYADAMMLGAMWIEFYLTYSALLAGDAPTALPVGGSYENYCAHQHQYTSALTLDSPEVRAWVDFFENNDGTLPECPVSLGDGSGACNLTFVQVMDQQETAQFESACIAAGARFSGGVFACAALAQYELTGAETYYGLIARDTRSAPADFMTMGWFTGYVPITVPVDVSSFGEMARAAQKSFDSGKELANVPFNRVLELAPWLRMPHCHIPLLFHLNATVPPLSTIINAEWDWSNIRMHHDGRTPARFDLRVNRYAAETQIIAFFPDNPIARKSVARYIDTLKSVYRRITEGFSLATPLPDGASRRCQTAS